MSQQSRWGLGWEAGWPWQKHPSPLCWNSLSDYPPSWTDQGSLSRRLGGLLHAGPPSRAVGGAVYHRETQPGLEPRTEPCRTSSGVRTSGGPEESGKTVGRAWGRFFLFRRNGFHGVCLKGPCSGFFSSSEILRPACWGLLKTPPSAFSTDPQT